MKQLMPFLVIVGMLMVGIKTPKAEEVCYDGVCFPDGDVSFADSFVSYNPGDGTGSPNTNPSAALGPPDYDGGGYFDGEVASLGRDGFLVVKFDDNSLTTSGSTDDDLWIFEVGTAVESTSIYISTDGVTWIQVGATSGATSGVDIDAYIGSGVELGERYSYVRITDDGTNNYNPKDGDGGPDIDAVGAIESAAPVTTTPTTTPDTSETYTITGKVFRKNGDPMKECIDLSGQLSAQTYSGETYGYYQFNDLPAGYYTVKPCKSVYHNWEPPLYDIHLISDLANLDFLSKSSFPGSVCPIDWIDKEHSEKVVILRNFRDNILTQTPEGRELIRMYYQWGPAIVKAMEADEAFKEDVKEVIDGFLLLLTEETE